MRVALALWCAAGAVQASLPRESSFPTNGERFVSLHKWSSSNKFGMLWEKEAKRVSLTNRWAQLAFQVDSRKAAINGTVVWLSAALPASRETVFISQRDLETLIEPVLKPPKRPQGRPIRTIALAAGHGGVDSGNLQDKQAEKTHTLLLTKMLAEELQAAGLKVIMTRTNDIYVTREEQAGRANRAKADLFVTLHYNSAPEVEAKGVETFCLTPAGATPTNGGGEPSQKSPGNKNDAMNALLAYHVQRAIVRDTDFIDRGVRRAGFQVLREITMPGILIEGGFMSNPFDAAKIYDVRQRRKMARAIADGILSYKRLVERP